MALAVPVACALAVVCACACVLAAPPPPANINGEYHVANAPNANVNLFRRSNGKYFDVYGPVHHSLYSQVNWKTHSVPLPDDIVKTWDGQVMNIVGYEFDIIRRIGGGACVTSSSDNPVPCAYESIPGWEQYNHHYTNKLSGKATQMVKTGIPSDGLGDMSSHTGHIDGYAMVMDPSVDNPAHLLEAAVPTSQFLPMGNGAESRLTLKYFPPGFGALIHSPTTSTVNIMMIDTKARNSSGVPGRHGPVPSGSNVGPEAMYSGIMECPCTDFYNKKPAGATMLDSGSCGKQLFATPLDCFAGAASLGLRATINRTVSSSVLPAGCSVTAISGGYDVTFNSNTKATSACGASNSTLRVVGMSNDDAVVNVTVDLRRDPMPTQQSIAGDWQIAGPIDTGSLVSVVGTATNQFVISCTGEKCFKPVSGNITGNQLYAFSIPGTIRSDNNKITFSNGVILNRWLRSSKPATALAGRWMFSNTTDPKILPTLGTVFTFTGSNDNLLITSPSGTQEHGTVRGNQLDAFPNVPGIISADGNTIRFTNTVVFTRIDPVMTAGTAEISLEGPADVWFGAGFRTSLPVPTPGSASQSAMKGAYALIVLGNGSLMERQLGQHTPGMELPASVKLVSSTVVDGRRKVIVSRPLAGLTPAHFTFNPTALSLGLINAIGYGPDFAQHKDKAMQQLFLVDSGAPSCLCDMAPPLGSTGSQGTIGPFSFNSNCQPRPLGEMLDDDVWRNTTTPYTDNNGVNPTCLINSYKGGLKCCRDGTLLTDGAEARAKLVAENQTDQWQVLYRYYYENGTNDADDSLVNDTYWTYWWTEHNNGEHDIPPCYNDECLDVITSNFTGADMIGHVPGVASYPIHLEGHCHIGCQNMELYNMDDPANPKLLCKTKVDYGTGDVAHNEMGYILGNQPCIYSFDPTDEFPPPPMITSTTKLMSIKTQNNTNARYADMALWEIRMAYDN